MVLCIKLNHMVENMKSYQDIYGIVSNRTIMYYTVLSQPSCVVSYQIIP